MKRTAWILGSMIALGGAFPPFAGDALAAGTVQVAAPQVAENALNPVVMVRDAVVRVSDIFSGPIPRGDRAVLAAPAPVQATRLGARVSVVDDDTGLRGARQDYSMWLPR